MTYIRELVFDERNIEHIARHGVTPEEVEEVCYLAPHFTRARSKRGRRRYRVIGQTEDGRYLTIFLDPLGKGVYTSLHPTIHPPSEVVQFLSCWFSRTFNTLPPGGSDV